MCSSLMFSFVLNVLAMIDVIDVTFMIISYSDNVLVFLPQCLHSTLKAMVGEILPFTSSDFPVDTQCMNPTLEQSLALTMSLRSELGGQFTEKVIFIQMRKCSFLKHRHE